KRGRYLVRTHAGRATACRCAHEGELCPSPRQVRLRASVRHARSRLTEPCVRSRLGSARSGHGLGVRSTRQLTPFHSSASGLPMARRPPLVRAPTAMHRVAVGQETWWSDANAVPEMCAVACAVQPVPVHCWLTGRVAPDPTAMHRAELLHEMPSRI